MSRPLPVSICKIRKSPGRWRQLVYHWLVQTAPTLIENINYFREICDRNRGKPHIVQPPDSALDPWGALETGRSDRIETQWLSKNEVAACDAKPAKNDHIAYTTDETEEQEPDSNQNQ